MPASLGFEAAAGVPLAALTAWQVEINLHGSTSEHCKPHIHPRLPFKSMYQSFPMKYPTVKPTAVTTPLSSLDCLLNGEVSCRTQILCNCGHQSC